MAFRFVNQKLRIAATVKAAPVAIRPYADGSWKPSSAANENPTIKRADPSMMRNLILSGSDEMVYTTHRPGKSNVFLNCLNVSLLVGLSFSDRARQTNAMPHVGRLMSGR